MIFKTLITARGGSKSIPKKNIIEISKKPLIAYSILASRESIVDETWVSTDDNQIKEVSIKWGAKVIDRPKELATDTILNEPEGGTHIDYDEAANTLKDAIIASIKEFNNVEPDLLIAERIKKYDKMGRLIDG